MSGAARGEEEHDGVGETNSKVPFLGMFRYADRTDAALMAVGTAAAVANGMAEPLMTVVFSLVIECFGAGDDSTILHRVSKVVMYYIYLGIGTSVASFLQVSCWTVAGERQSTRLRSLYLDAVLRQEIAFFDVEMTTAEAASRMSADTVLIQDALGEKVGKHIQLLTTFVGGFIIGFIRGWMLALVMLASIPPCILSFATVSRLRAQISGKRQESYGDAGNVVEQTIGAIRTVASFNGEKKAIAKYNTLIKRAYKATFMEGIITGLGIGCVFFVVFGSYSLAFWYGATLIISKGYTGGQVINVVFAILTGSIDNITYGKEDATLEEIKRAAELANAANFIEKLPNAYETMVGQRGAQLSGGQKQRIAIARAILKNPKILLLDEATSALDVESERVVQEALNRIMVGRTTLIVAHRLSTIRNADCIAVIHQGKVVERGAHDELIKDPDGAYSQLIQLQQAHNEERNEVTNIQVYFALVFTAFGISQTSGMASDSTKAKESAASILAIIDRKSKIDSTNNEGVVLDKVDGNIDFKHVSFKYPSRPDVQVLSDFTLAIPARKTVALVGESGSGKSTIIALLERYYDPDSGTISLDGVELNKLKLTWLRDQMGLVSQEPVLFSDTIHANISYGKQGEVTEEEIITAAKAANAHEFISSLPQGYSTTVGERGTRLSGGQKQRVAIARAILKDPRILLLDEATSALDAESERIVQDALDQVNGQQNHHYCGSSPVHDQRSGYDCSHQRW
ncbi:hypothetical protein PR202_ga10022 [Eleusine coracana subsp. coracana]|uniref:Uncharacterized protein n=1 Tax=Eleusine coracana subsp. coracana TaxID=191504 RepID=A0AAV5C5N0_ELECO|nr:hypothetical protein PR202_ga10022 [Eleusine coracana subsp. coracana]